MEFGLINAGLAAGATLAAVPLILHLFMRQTPKRVVFPALRLIKERQKRSQKRLRVKNWLLLLARMALLALMALALARPRLTTEASLGDQEVPSAIAFVFDTSLSMEYAERDKSRLDEARERVDEILGRTIGSSQIFVVDSADPGAPKALSPASARKRVQGLTTRPGNRPLNVAVGQAIAAVAASDKPRREVYVLTDLARSAWDPESAIEGVEKADQAKVATYVLRLTPKEPRNAAVVEARPASGSVTEGESLEILGRVRSVGPASSRIAEFRLDGVVRGKKPVDLPADGEVDVRFTLPKVEAEPAVHQGEIRITGAPDPLTFDDARYFTFEVRPPVRILVVSDEPIDARFLGDALDPDPATLAPGAPRPYRAERIKTAEFVDRSAKLADQFECVFLNNTGPLSDAEWGRLGGFVRGGGGLVVGLGSRSVAIGDASGTASQVLPALPERVVKPNPATSFGKIGDYSHPLFARYARDLDDMLATVPVSRYWAVAPREGTRTLLSYADGAPALIERTFKGSRTGRVLLWTTPLSRRPEADSKDAWNEFPNPILGWSFFHLMNQSVVYLTGAEERVWNFEAGQDVVLPIDPAARAKGYVVQGPDARSRDRLNPASGSDALVVVAPEKLGHWKVTGEAEGQGPAQAARGFSVNGPIGESQFTPLADADLEKLFGDKKRFAVADDPTSLRNAVIVDRVGRELFPWIMAIILVVVTIESLLANRFYREVGHPSAQAAPQPAA